MSHRGKGSLGYKSDSLYLHRKMLKKPSEDKSPSENAVRKPVSPSGAVLICRRKELAQQPGPHAFYFAPTSI